MSPKHAAVNFIFFQEWPAASLKKENIDWFLSDRVATVGKKSFPGIYVTTEAVTPHGEWSGSATAWWEAVWSIRILLKKCSKVINHKVPHIKAIGYYMLSKTVLKKLQNQQLPLDPDCHKRCMSIFEWFLNLPLSRVCELHSARLQHSCFRRCTCSMRFFNLRGIFKRPVCLVDLIIPLHDYWFESVLSSLIKDISPTRNKE